MKDGTLSFDSITREIPLLTELFHPIRTSAAQLVEGSLIATRRAVKPNAFEEVAERKQVRRRAYRSFVNESATGDA